MEQQHTHRLDFLIELFHQKKLTEAEHNELVDLLALPEHEHQASLFLDAVWEKTPESTFFSLEKSAMLQKTIMDQIEPRTKKLWSNKMLLRMITAAAIVTLVFSFIFINQYKTNNGERKIAVNKNNTPFVADIGPGGNKATLKLANNRVIVLDQVKNGVLVDIGNMLVKKNQNGQLVFEAKSTTENNTAATGENILTTPAGGQYEVLLADGSKVWLNASSSLKFPTVFSGKERNVELTGEGYFEISKSKDQPFIVNAKAMKIEVLGTHFNINAYPDEQSSATTLIEGSIRFSYLTNTVLLKPNEQAKVKNQSFKINKNIDVQEVLAWKEGYFIFDNEEIHSVMRKLARWYNVRVEYEDPSVNEEFVGTISKYKNISEILKLLQATGTIKFKILPSQDPNYERRVIVMK